MTVLSCSCDKFVISILSKSSISEVSTITISSSSVVYTNLPHATQQTVERTFKILINSSCLFLFHHIFLRHHVPTSFLLAIFYFILYYVPCHHRVHTLKMEWMRQFQFADDLRVLPIFLPIRRNQE